MARAYKPIAPQIGFQGIYEVSTTQQHALGTRVRAIDVDYGEGEFIYLKGVASCIEGAFVTFNADDGTTALLVANAIGPVAVAPAAIVADRYGWFQVYGKAVGKVSASFADNGNVYATATAGEVDDAIVAGDRVKNCKGASAIATPAAGLAEMELAYPFMDDALAA
jgi:hypothetical protein